jgi:hypothetical protein
MLQWPRRSLITLAFIPFKARRWRRYALGRENGQCGTILAEKMARSVGRQRLLTRAVDSLTLIFADGVTSRRPHGRSVLDTTVYVHIVGLPCSVPRRRWAATGLLWRQRRRTNLRYPVRSPSSRIVCLSKAPSLPTLAPTEAKSQPIDIPRRAPPSTSPG